MNNQNNILNLSNRSDINDSSLENILRKFPKKLLIKELNISKTSITHIPSREILLLFPNLEKLNLTNTLIHENKDYITISYELQSIPKLYFLDIMSILLVTGKLVCKNNFIIFTLIKRIKWTKGRYK